jgi:hypothetical protein
MDRAFAGDLRSCIRLGILEVCGSHAARITLDPQAVDDSEVQPLSGHGVARSQVRRAGTAETWNSVHHG